MLNPKDQVYWNIPITANHPEYGQMKCIIKDNTVWGWSVWKRKGGYRTYGLSVEVMLNRGWVFYE